ncbi:MAG: hypothetical protein LBQ01_00445 [Prevotellaceae bacterium]|nr:hypothetical protein [Prevotellaceae bacterium]
MMTLKNTAHIRCKYHRPLSVLFFAILSLAGALYYANIPYGNSSLLTVLTIISVILFLVFYFNKHITIVVETCGGKTYQIGFKPSLIENVDVTLGKAQEVVELINSQIIKEQERRLI